MLSALQEGVMPHGMCYLWRPELLWLHVVSDGLVALAYFAIPPSLIWIVLSTRRRLRERRIQREFPFAPVFWAFAGFIVACGVTHAFGVWTVWHPDYWVSGSAKAATATISLATAIGLPLVAPRISRLIADALERESISKELRESNAFLERTTAELVEAQESRRTAVRTMAGWLAHDLNNRLQGIQGSAELLRIGGDDAGAMSSLTWEVNRAASTIRDLQAIAGVSGGVQRESVDLGVMVRSVGAEASDAGERAVSIDYELPEHLPVVANAYLLERILRELVRNAAEGSVDRRIRITSASGVGSGHDLVRLSVRNRIEELPASVRDSIFDAFVTTKVGRSGLGLSIARRHAIELGGSLDVAFGRGEIELRLVLPTVDPAPRDQPPGGDG